MASQNSDRLRKLKAFDETNAGVKGVVDSGIQEIPDIFVRPQEELAREPKHEATAPLQTIQIPAIDLADIRDPERRRAVVGEVKSASETWGFFHVVNHGIPQAVLDAAIGGVNGFMELGVEEKRRYYSRDATRPVRYTSSYDLFTSRTASWRDTLSILCLGPGLIDPKLLPDCCRESTMEYSTHIEILGNDMLGLLSEALGLETDHLKNMECSKGHRLHNHYYPPCPQPQLAIGIAEHSDIGFLTILLQSQGISGLQVLYEGRWVNVDPIPGGLVVNIGDLLER